MYTAIFHLLTGVEEICFQAGSLVDARKRVDRWYEGEPIENHEKDRLVIINRRNVTKIVIIANENLQSAPEAPTT